MDTLALGGVLSHIFRQMPVNGLARDLFQSVGQLMVPGIIISASIPEQSSNWCLGSGVVQVPPKHNESPGTMTVLIRNLGILCYAPPHEPMSSASSTSPPTHRLWVESLPLLSKSNSPSLFSAPQTFHTSHFSVGDRVLGVVKKKSGDNFMLDIGCASPASLNYLSFEGASKKNRPDIHLKDVIYAAVSQCDPDLEIELTCVDESGKASGMGILGRHEPGCVGNAGASVSGGVMVNCSLALVRRLANAAQFPLLEKLSQKFPFEVCVGCNGRIWITARSPRETMLLANTIALADFVAPEICLEFTENLC